MTKSNDSMTPKELEQRIAELPAAPLPAAWRNEILRSTRGPKTDPEIEPRWRWSDWLWPCPQAWVGLAACWLALAPLLFRNGQPAPAPVAVVMAEPEEPVLTVAAVSVESVHDEPTEETQKPAAERPRSGLRRRTDFA